MSSHLGVSFALICFQRLSIPNLATQQCPWQDNRYTRGRFIPVLSSCFKPRVTTRIDYIFIPHCGSRRIIADFSPLSWHKALVVTGLYYKLHWRGKTILFCIAFVLEWANVESNRNLRQDIPDKPLSVIMGGISRLTLSHPEMRFRCLPPILRNMTYLRTNAG